MSSGMTVEIGRPESESTTWQAEMKRAVRCPQELCRRLRLPAQLAREAESAAEGFPLFVPEPFLARIRPNDPQDPLLKQVLPVSAEGRLVPGYSPDPVGDLAAQSSPGVIRKYAGRALLVVSGACAVHCRYCFRRHFPYPQAPHSLEQWRRPLAQLARDPEVTELILSGGDPLTLNDSQLEAWFAQIESMPYLQRVRLHTRLPLMIPARVTLRFATAFGRLSAAKVLVIHVNHAQEMDDEVDRALRVLAEAGVLLLNQAVLLRGVNDSIEALAALSARLIRAGVLPYYLHQLDKVQGAAHFRVPESQGQQLVRQLRAQLPGYAVPAYVRDDPRQPFKRVLA